MKNIVKSLAFISIMALFFWSCTSSDKKKQEEDSQALQEKIDREIQSTDSLQKVIDQAKLDLEKQRQDLQKVEEGIEEVKEKLDGE